MPKIMKLTLKRTSTNRLCQRLRFRLDISSRWTAALKQLWVGQPKTRGSRAKRRALSIRSLSTTRVNSMKKKQSHFRAWKMCTVWVFIAACLTTVITSQNKFWWTLIQRLSQCLARRTKRFYVAGSTRRTTLWWISKPLAIKSQSSSPLPLPISISTTMRRAALKTFLNN